MCVRVCVCVHSRRERCECVCVCAVILICTVQFYLFTKIQICRTVSSLSIIIMDISISLLTGHACAASPQMKKYNLFLQALLVLS